MSVVLPSPRTLGDLAAIHGGTLDPGLETELIRSIAPVTSATRGELAPLVSPRYVNDARKTEAALLVDEKLAALVEGRRRWIHPRASLVLARLLEPCAPAPPADARERAFVDPLAIVHETAVIGPFCVVYAGAEIGPGCRLEPHVVVYSGVRLGARVSVGASSVLGRPGFGWTTSPEGLPVRVPQLGGLVVEDDVEIGPLCTLDAGTLSPTRIGRFAKLDAHVHVGHNAEIGQGALVAAQSGFAGSSRLGRGALVGGQVGVADHCDIGDGARLAAKAGVIGDVPAGATFAGYPAVDKARWLRATARALEGFTRKNRKSS